MSIRLLLSFLVIPFATIASIAQTATTPDAKAMTTLDMVEFARLSNPRLSGDGRYLIYQRSEVDWEANKQLRRWRILDVSNGQLVPGFEPEDQSESLDQGVWAGTHGVVLTTYKGEGDDKKQAYAYALKDQSFRRLTDFSENVKSIRWAPDDSGFYFRVRSARTSQDRADLEADWAIAEYETRQLHELWFYNWQTRIVSPVLTGDFDVREYSISPSGDSIVFARVAHGLLDRPGSELWHLDLKSRQSARLTDNGYSEQKARLSPQGDRVAYVATVNADGDPYYEDNAFVRAVERSEREKGTEQELILPDEPMEMIEVQWNADGSGLYILGNVGLRQHIFSYDLETSVLQAITEGDASIVSWSYLPATDMHVYIRRSAENPGEVWMQAGSDKHGKQLTQEYTEFVSRYAIPEQQAYSWRARDGQQVEGLLVLPLGYDKESGQRFPLVTITHGGPRQSVQFGSWNMSRYVPVLAGQGFGILLPNHRGSTGYGDRFMRDMVGKYFRNAHLDVLAGIDALIDEGMADPDQLIKMGWSAGGHMTNKIITVTDRFRAASSGAGGSDWTSLYGESDVRDGRTPWFGAAPWDGSAGLRKLSRQSMLQDANRVTTPTLFFVGEKDVRVPPTQAIMMYRGVKATGTSTALYVAPGQPHGFEKPSYQLFKMNRELQWYAEHLDRPAYEPALPKQRMRTQ